MNNTGQQNGGKAKDPLKPSPPKSNCHSELCLSLKEGKLLNNEMKPHRNGAFHDGYDKGKKSSPHESNDTGYKKAFEQNFILSILKGVANALKSSYNLNNKHHFNNEINQRHHQTNRRPSSANYSTSTTHATRNISNASSISPSIAQTPSSDSTESTASSSPKSTSMMSTTSSNSSNKSSPSSKDKHHHHRHSTGLSSSRLLAQKYQMSGRRSAASGRVGGNSHDSNHNDNRNSAQFTSDLSSISSGNVSASGSNFSSSNLANVIISDNHMSLLESMKFDGSCDIESLKSDLIRICRENRLEILAHYVSQIG